LQIVVSDPELDSYRQAARRNGLTLSEWARRGLREAERQSATGDPDRKFAAIRTAARYEFPTDDIAALLREIELGDQTDQL